MAIDHDASRAAQPDELVDDEIEELTTARGRDSFAPIDADEADPVELFELPGADLPGEKTAVVAKHADEFVCSSCFLVYHRSRLAGAARETRMAAKQNPLYAIVRDRLQTGDDSEKSTQVATT